MRERVARGRDKRNGRERKTRDRARVGGGGEADAAWEDGEKQARGRWGRDEKREDEDIYLAASTVLKTAVVHFAELPRGSTSSGGGIRDGEQGDTHDEGRGNRGGGEIKREKKEGTRRDERDGAGGL